MNFPTVPASMANALFGFAVDRGAEPSALLEASALTSEVLNRSDGRVSLEQYMALMRSAEMQCDDPAFALHFAQSVGAMQVSVVCLIGSTCETMADAVAHLNRYRRLTLDVGSKHGGDHFITERASDGIWLIDDRLYPPHCHQLTACTLLRKVVGTRQLTAERFVRAVHFVDPEPLKGADYEELFGAPVRFGMARNAMLMDPAWFALRVRVSPAYVSPILIEHADRLLRSLSDRQSTRGRVAAVLAERLSHEGADMTSVARDLAVSRATLYRALQQEGTTFARVLDDVRRDRAMHRLSTGGPTVQQVAHETGFSEPAAFSRAFKRWTGETPLGYRALCRVNGGQAPTR
jgi:AraC-like DNA-binding protein